MSKRAEERALEAYPNYPTLDGGYITQRKTRRVFIQGYEAAEKDTIERAVAWLKTRTFMFDSTEQIDLFIDLFRQAMEAKK